jgi:superfamily II DNA helicase RecQ
MTNFEIITIPFNKETESFDTEFLNTFCANKKIIEKRVESFRANDKLYWTVFLEYETILPKQKEETDLSEAEEVLFEKLRVWRKEKAEKAGVPVYIISTNKQLKELVMKKPKSLEEIKSIDGFGKKKIENYGSELLTIIKNFWEIS